MTRPHGALLGNTAVAARERGIGVRGVHVLAVTAILLAAVAVRATESYATRPMRPRPLNWLAACRARCRCSLFAMMRDHDCPRLVRRQ